MEVTEMDPEMMKTWLEKQLLTNLEDSDFFMMKKEYKDICRKLRCAPKSILRFPVPDGVVPNGVQRRSPSPPPPPPPRRVHNFSDVTLRVFEKQGFNVDELPAEVRGAQIRRHKYGIGYDERREMSREKQQVSKEGNPSSGRNYEGKQVEAKRTDPRDSSAGAGRTIRGGVSRGGRGHPSYGASGGSVSSYEGRDSSRYMQSQNAGSGYASSGNGASNNWYGPGGNGAGSGGYGSYGGVNPGYGGPTGDPYGNPNSPHTVYGSYGSGPAGASRNPYGAHEFSGFVGDVARPDLIDGEHQTNHPCGFGFISFDNEDAVDRVLQKNFHDLNGKQVEVKRALPRDSNAGGGRTMRGGASRGRGYPSYGTVGCRVSSYEGRDSSRCMQSQNTCSGYASYGPGGNGAGSGGYSSFGGACHSYGGPTGYGNTQWGASGGSNGGPGSAPVSAATCQSSSGATAYGNQGYGNGGANGSYGNPAAHGAVGGRPGGAPSSCLSPGGELQSLGGGYMGGNSGDPTGNSGSGNQRWRSEPSQGAGSYGAPSAGQVGYGGGYGAQQQ